MPTLFKKAVVPQPCMCETDIHICKSCTFGLAVQIPCQTFHRPHTLVHALRLQGQQHYSRDEVDAALAAHQHELTVTQQAFHAKQVQLEGQPPFLHQPSVWPHPIQREA